MFATRFTLEAVEAVGAGRSWDGAGASTRSRRSSTARSSSRPRSAGASSFSLLAIVREYALGRAQGARRGRRGAARRTPTTTAARRAASHPSCAGARQADAVAQLGPRAAEPARGRAPPRLHRPARRRRRLRLEPAHLLVDLGLLRRGAAVDAGAARQGAADHARTRAASRWFFTLWGEMWQRPSRAGGRGARRVRAPVHRERRRGCRGDGARRAGDGAHAVPRPRHREAAGRSSRTRSRRSARSATGGRRRSPRSSLGRLGVAARRASTTRSRTSTARPRSPRPAATSSRASSRATSAPAWTSCAATSRPPRRSSSARCSLSIRAALRRGRRVRARGLCAVAAARGDAWRAARSRRRGRGDPPADRRLRRRGASRCTSQPLAALREIDPGGVAAGERRRGRDEPRRGVAIAVGLRDLRRRQRDRASRGSTARGRSRHGDMTASARRDPHARPADPGVRELDPARARRRTTRSAVGDRAHAARARHVRARRPPASAPRPLPLLPRAERRLRRHLRRELRLGRPRRGGLRPRGRVQPRPRRRCPSSSTSRRPTHRDERLNELIARIQRRRHRRLPPLPHRRRPRGPASPATSPRSSPNASTRSRAPAADREPATGVPPSRACPSPTPPTIGREDDIAARARRCSRAATTAW